MLACTSTSSIWGQFYVGCYSSRGSAGLVSLAIHGIPGPLGPTIDGGRERLLGGGSFSWLTKNPDCLLLVCSPLIELHWSLRKFCCLQDWCRLLSCMMVGRCERHSHLFFLLWSRIDHLGCWGSWVSSWCDRGEGVAEN